MSGRVVFHPKAEQDLANLYDYIADQSSPSRAWNFIEGITQDCLTLEMFPQRGNRRDDILPGLRVIGYRRSASIAFTAMTDEVIILGIFYRGRQIDREILQDRY